MWNFKHIAIFTAVLAALLAQACSGNSHPELPEQEEPTRLRLRLTVEMETHQNPVEATRTPSPGDYDPGSWWENYIDFVNPETGFRILFFNHTDEYVGTLENVIPVSTSPISKKYDVTGDIPMEILEKNHYYLKTVLLANWKSYPELTPYKTTLANLAKTSSAIFNKNNDIMVGEGNLVPMFGIKDCQTIGLNHEQPVELGTIHMLRAFAKIEVEVAEDSDIPMLDRVELNFVNDRYYAFPPGVTEERDYKKDKYDQDYLELPSVPVGTETYESVSFAKVDETTDTGGTQSKGARRWRIYVPEFAIRALNDGEGVSNSTTVENPAKILIHFEGMPEGEKEKPYEIEFKYYENPPAYVSSYKKDDYFDIMRNYWYHYTVKKKPLQLDVTLDVTPYNSVVLEPEFGLDRDENGNIIYPKSDETNK